MESCQLADLKYAIFSRTGRKTKKLPRSKLFLWTVLKPIQARGALGAPHLYHSKSPKRLGVWSSCLVNFFYVYSVQKSSVPPIGPHVCCHGNHATFRLIFENSKSRLFLKYFRLRKTFCKITFYALDIKTV